MQSTTTFIRITSTFSNPLGLISDMVEEDSDEWNTRKAAGFYVESVSVL